jgi:hypothetical protein
MRVAYLVAILGVCGCAQEPVSKALKEDCDAHVCPTEPPEYIDCMPVIAPDWQPICDNTCRAFFQSTCHIQFVE